jgi:hypothetical protein
MNGTTDTDLSCAVALRRERNRATLTQGGATMSATDVQPIGLKALAIAVLQRNQQRNLGATGCENERNFVSEIDLQKLRTSSTSCAADPNQENDAPDLPAGCPLYGAQVPDGCRFEERFFNRMVATGVLPSPAGGCPLRRVCGLDRSAGAPAVPHGGGSNLKSL